MRHEHVEGAAVGTGLGWDVRLVDETRDTGQRPILDGRQRPRQHSDRAPYVTAVSAEVDGHMPPAGSRDLKADRGAGRVAPDVRVPASGSEATEVRAIHEPYI